MSRCLKASGKKITVEYLLDTKQKTKQNEQK